MNGAFSNICIYLISIEQEGQFVVIFNIPFKKGIELWFHSNGNFM